MILKNMRLIPVLNIGLIVKKYINQHILNQMSLIIYDLLGKYLRLNCLKSNFNVDQTSE